MLLQLTLKFTIWGPQAHYMADDFFIPNPPLPRTPLVPDGSRHADGVGVRPTQGPLKVKKYCPPPLPIAIPGHAPDASRSSTCM